MRSQSHDHVELTQATWPIASGTLNFPATKDGISAHDAGPDEWHDVLREIADAGFQHLELTDTWLAAAALNKSERAELQAISSSVGLDLTAVALIRKSVLDPKDGDANFHHSVRSIEAAAELGASVVSVGLHEPLTDSQKNALWFWLAPGARNDPNDKDAWDWAVRRFKQLGAIAAMNGVLLTLEMYEDTFLGTAESACRLVEEVGLANVGLNPDTGNLIRLHRPIENWDEVLKKVLPFANYWHVKNYQRDEDPSTGSYFATPTTLEAGLINYRAAIRSAIAAGFAGVITCEHYGGDGLSVSATNQQYLRKIIPSVGNSLETAT